MGRWTVTRHSSVDILRTKLVVSALLSLSLIISGCKAEVQEVEEKKPEVAASSGSTATVAGPTSSSISIAAGAAYATSTSVTLTLGATGASDMYITNTSGCSSGGVYETYATSKAWTLGQSNATATVYVKYKDSTGVESSCISDTIIHDNTVANPTITSHAENAIVTSSTATFTGACEANSTLTISSTGPGPDTTAGTVSCNGSGNLSIDMTFSGAGGGSRYFSVYQTDPAGNVSGTLTRTIKYLPFSLSQSLVKAAYVNGADANNIMTVGNGDAVTVKVTTKDSGGDQLTIGGLTIAFSLSGGTSSGTFGSVTDNNDGTYTATFTANTVGTNSTLNATINTSSITSTRPLVNVVTGANDGDFAGTNMLSWYKADSMAAVDGTAMGTWTDSGPNAWDATQATAANKPAFYNNVVNGKSVMRFYNYAGGAWGTSTCSHANNGGTWFEIDNVATGAGGVNSNAANEFTAFVVAKQGMIGNGGFTNRNYLFAFQSGAYVDIWRMMTQGNGACTDTAPDMRYTWYANGSTNFVKTNVTTGDAFHVYSMTFHSNKDINFYLDGGTATTATSTGTTDPASVGRGYIGVQLEGAGVSDGFYDGDMAEIIFYRSALTNSNRQAIQDYLAAKYGLTIAH